MSGGSHGAHAPDKKSGLVSTIKGAIWIIVLAGVFGVGYSLWSGAKVDMSRKVEMVKAEKERLATVQTVVVDPLGRNVSPVQLIEVRHGRPRSYTFTRPGEVIVVRYLGDGPEYRDEPGSSGKQVGVWVAWPFSGWTLDEPGTEDDKTPVWSPKGDVLFAGRAKGQTLVFNVVN